MLLASALAAGCERIDDGTGADGDGTMSPASAPVPVVPGDPIVPEAPPSPGERAELAAITALVARGELERARMRAGDFLVRRPNDGEATFLLGLTWHEQRNYPAARPLLERALVLDPERRLVHHFLGYCLYNLGALDEARRAFEAHLDAMPDEPDSHFGLGLVALEQNRLEDAEASFGRSIELIEGLETTNPGLYGARRRDVAKAKVRLADIAMARKQYEAARDLLVDAIAIDPSAYPAYHVLSTAYRRLGDDENADRMLAEHDRVRDALSGRAQPAP